MRERIETFALNQHRKLRALIVEPARVKRSTPVLLFLHGRGEASEQENELQKVCAHCSPPDQARRDRLKNVIVVAPQAPEDPEKQWDWEPYLLKIKEFLRSRFNGHRILATGFSRGGLGVLQFILKFPNRVSRWAIIDPQPHPDGATKLTPEQCTAGWMRYGNQYAAIKNFGDAFRHRLGDAPDCRNMLHAPLARAAYGEKNAEVLGGKYSVYGWLGVTHTAGEIRRVR